MRYANQPDVRITVALPDSGPVDIALSYPLSREHETLLRQLHEGGVAAGVIECRMHDDDYGLKEFRDESGRVRGAWLYLRRHGDRLLLCHWPRAGVGGTHFVPSPMTAEHRRSQEYIALRGEANGYSVALEKSLATGTRSDVVVRGDFTLAAEVQVSGISVASVMRRTNAATNAGACTTWFAGVESPPAWTHKVPTVLTNKNTRLDPNSWTVTTGPRGLEWERCTPSSRFERCPERRPNFCGQWHPIWRPLKGITVDRIVEQIPGGGLVRLDTGVRQGTVLTTPEDKLRWEEHAGAPTKLSTVSRPATPGLNHSDYSVEKLRERIRTGAQPSGVRPDQIPAPRPTTHIQPNAADLALYSSQAKFQPNGRVAREADIDGHLWPVTGYRCSCGMPVIPCYTDQWHHPECDPRPRVWTDAQMRQWADVKKQRLLVEQGRAMSERLLRRSRR